VPKKKKIVQDKNETSPDDGGSFKVKAGKGNRARRATANRSRAKPVQEKTQL